MKKPSLAFIRVLKTVWWLLKIAILVFGFLFLSHFPGGVTVRWMGFDVHLNLGFAAACILALFAVLYAIMGFLKSIKALGRYFCERRQQKHRELAKTHLNAAINDLFSKDYEQCLYHLKKSSKHDNSNAPLIKALQGIVHINNHSDSRQIHNEFHELTHHPEFKFLGYFGLVKNASSLYEKIHILELAYEQLPSNPWILKNLLDYYLALEIEKFAEVIIKSEKLVDTLYYTNHITKEEKKALSAQISWKQSLYKKMIKNDDGALALAEEALDYDPSHVEAAIYVAEHITQAKAQRLLAQTFKLNPSKDLTKAILRLFPKDVETFHYFEKELLDGACHKTLFLLASLAFYCSLWGRARQILKEVPKEFHTSYYYLLLSQIAFEEKEIETSKQLQQKALSYISGV